MRQLLEGTSHTAIPVLFMAVFLIAAYRKVDVYAAFIEGAKEGFDTAVKIIPYLVGILAAISMVRSTGLIDALSRVLGPVTEPLGIPAEVMPMVLIRPLSGSGANAVLVDIMKSYGPDGYAARLASVISSCAETTFYVLAVYFGSVGITNLRYALVVGILGEAVSVVMSVIVCRLAWG
ncbi:MAG: spore maturation protein [Deltaproteobacteria bacterium]|nr:spore maturation protein [Deltaproteobacteria bacterium]